MNASLDVVRKEPLGKGPFFVEASAGTGKTFAITHLVLRSCVEEGIPLEKMAIMTFTKSAAIDLRRRLEGVIVSALLALEGEKTELPYLQVWQQAANKEQIKLSLQSMLLAMPSASIGTIHRFCKEELSAFKGPMSIDQHLSDRIFFNFCRSLLLKTPLSPKQLRTLIGQGLDDFEERLEKAATARDEKVEELDLEALAKKLIPFKRESTFFEKECPHLTDHFNGLKGVNLLENWDNLLDLCDWKKVTLSKKQPKEKRVTVEYWSELFLILATFRERELLQKSFGAKLSALQKKSALDGAPLSPDHWIFLAKNASEDPRFCAKVKERYAALVVDEFQDTDPLQWEIFEKLFVKDRKAFLLFVGDPKQSIYRFRNADPTLFHRVKEELGAEAIYTLSQNYRSQPKLVEAVNRLFCAHGVGEVDFSPVKAAKKDQSDLPPIIVLEGDSANFVDGTVAEVQKLLEGGVPPQDIAILVRDGKEGRSYLAAMKRAKIKAIFARSEIQEHPFFDHLWLFAQALAQGESHFLRLIGGPALDPLFFYLKKAFLLGKESFLRALLSSNMPHFADQEDILALLAERLSPLPTARELLELLEKERKKELSQVAQESVNIMTMHGSKGLEFDYLFLPGLSRKSKKNLSIEDENEEIRLLYVAMTRACIQNFLYFDPNEKNSLLLRWSKGDLFSFAKRQPLCAFHGGSLFEKSLARQKIPTPSKRELPLPKLSYSALSTAQKDGFLAILPENEKLPLGIETGRFLHELLDGLWRSGLYAFPESKRRRDLIEGGLWGTPLFPYVDEIDKITKTLGEIEVEGKRLCDFPPSKLRSELPFLYDDFTGEIDLLVEGEKGVYLFDWKTTALPNYSQEQIEAAMERFDYHRQREIYEGAIKKLSNRPLIFTRYYFVRAILQGESGLFEATYG